MDIRRIKNYILYGVYGVAILVSIIISIKLTTTSVKDSLLSTVTYMAQGSTNYKIYYENNPYYPEEFYDKTASDRFAGNLIDKIDILFDYHVNYSDIVSGNISYYAESFLYVEGVLNKPMIHEDKISEVYTDKSKDINKVLTINYKEYKDLYNSYVNELGPAYAGDAFIHIFFRVNNKVKYQSMDDIKDDNYLELIIPISDDPITILEYTDMEENENTLSLKENVDNIKVFNNFASISMWLVTILLIVAIYIRYTKEVENSSPYKKKLAKILRNHDDVIVNAKRLPNLDSYTVIETVSFKELLDAQSEVDMPINFKEEKTQAKFILIKDNLAWVYYLKEDKKD